MRSAVGRDLASLRCSGFEAFGVEPVESFRIRMAEQRPDVGGRLLLSVPAERPGIVNGRDAAGRLLSGVRAHELEVIAVDVGLERVKVWTDWRDLQRREGYSWDALMLERSEEDRRI